MGGFGSSGNGQDTEELEKLINQSNFLKINISS